MIKKHSEKDLINNEQHIYDCFSKTTAFLGLDRVEVSNKRINKVRRNQVTNFLK